MVTGENREEMEKGGWQGEMERDTYLLLPQRHEASQKAECNWMMQEPTCLETQNRPEQLRRD